MTLLIGPAGVIILIFLLILYSLQERKIANHFWGLNFKPSAAKIFLIILPFVAFWLIKFAPNILSIGSGAAAGCQNTVLVVDVSMSMSAEDVDGSVSRFERVKGIIEELIDLCGRGNKGKMGILTFAGTTLWQAEPTYDLLALEFIVKEWLTLNREFMNTGSSLESALADLLNYAAEDGGVEAAVIFSDGAELEQVDMQQVGSLVYKLAGMQIPIHTVGIGGKTPAPIPIYDSEGKFINFFKIEGRVAGTKLNPEPLILAAESTGGRYIEESSFDSPLAAAKELFSLIKSTAPETKEQAELENKIILYPIVAVVSIFLLLLAAAI